MEDKIIEFLDQGEFTEEALLKTFTFNERKIIALEGNYDTAVFLSKCQSRNIHVLTPEEAWELINLPSTLEGGTLLDTLSDYLTQDQLYKFTLEQGFTIAAYRITNGKYVVSLIEKGIIPKEELLNCICNIEEDSIKLGAMRRYLKKEDYFSVLLSLNTDGARIDSLRYIPRSERGDIIERIESDEVKESFITLMQPNKGSIIATLKSDEVKEHYFNKFFRFFNAYEKARIVASFKDVAYIEKYIDRLKSGIAIAEYFSRSTRTDDIHIKEKLADSITKEDDIIHALSRLPEGTIRTRLLSRLRTDKYIKELFSSDRYKLSDAVYMIERVDESLKEFIAKRLSNKSIIYTLLKYLSNEKVIMNIIDHQDSYPDYQDEYEYLVDIYTNKYHLNKEHLIALLKTVGCSLFNKINNENIQKTINLDEEPFSKYLRIINPENYTVTESAQNDVLNSFIHREFRLTQRNYYEIFPNLVHALDDNNQELVGEILDEIGNYIDYKEFNTSKEELLIGLKKYRVNTLNLINEITPKYLVLKRNEFVREQMESSKRICSNRHYEKNSFANFFFKRKKPEVILEDIKLILDGFDYTKEELALIEDSELFIKLFSFKKDSKLVGDLLPEEKKKLSILISIIDKRYNTHVSGNKPIPIKYEIKPTKMSDVVSIMAGINPEQLQQTLFQDEESFKELITFLKQYRILGWSGKYERIALDADVVYSEYIVSELINNYGAIIKAIEQDAKAKNVPVQKTLTRIMDRASLYDSYSRRYNVLFGKEDMAYLKTNPTPNSSGLSREERIKAAVSLVPKMYQRKSIPVPPVDKTYELKNNRKINIVVGNTTDMINLTYGERTGACMRIGGAGNSLFNYCLLGKNGFHIRFTDPKTNDFVSRVSCFRNGNTLFMNQLRDSVSPEYSNRDLIEATELIAKELIELTKDSELPIDNVVINNNYAMGESNKHPQDIGVEDIKKGLDDFYSDVDSYAIVVATSDPNNKLVPIKLSGKVPEYLPQRSKKNIYKGEKAIEMVAHYHLLDEILDGKSIEKKDIELNENIVTCICGEDWYVAIDSFGVVHNYVLKNTRRKKEALEEMGKAITELRQQEDVLSPDERKLA